MEKQEYLGKFWLPENPDNELWGVLRIDEDFEITYTVYYSYNKSKLMGTIFRDDDLEFCQEVVYGKLVDGRSVILAKVSQNGGQIGGNAYISYRCEYMLFDDKCAAHTLQDLVYKRVSFRFPLIEYFFTDFHPKVVREEGLIKVIQKMEIESFDVSPTLKIIINYLVFYSGPYKEKVSIENVTSIMLQFSEPKNIECIVEHYIRRLSEFITILTGTYLCPMDVKLFDFDYDSKYDTYIEAYYSNFNKGLVSERNHNLTKFEFIRPVFGNSVCEFINFCDTGSYILDSYIGGVFRNSSVMENDFLNTVTALEGILRDFTKRSTYIGKAELKKHYQPYVKEFIQSLDENMLSSRFIKRVEGIMNDANNMGFDMLIHNFINDNKELFDQLLLGDKESIVTNIVKYRNIYAHVKKNKPVSHSDYRLLNDIWKNAQVIFDVFLYKLIKMPDDIIIKIIRNVYGYYVFQAPQGLRRPTKLFKKDMINEDN